MTEKTDENVAVETPKKSKLGKIIGITVLIIALIPVTIFSAFMLFFCADTYGNSAEYENCTVAYGYYWGIHKILGQNHAAVTSYTVERGSTERDIYIPDEYDGIKIKELGGYIGRGSPSPFRIQYEYNPKIRELTDKSTDEFYGTGVGSFASTAEGDDVFDEVIYDDFTLHIGKNIKNIDAFDDVYLFDLKDGRKAAYCPRVYVICDEKNKNFYSEDGILYNKDGTKVEGFAYVGRELKTH